MAGRGGKSKADPPLRAVEDSELFPFQLDSTPPIVVARATSAKAKPAPEKPHYQDHRARLRQRFDEAGASALADYELLELMLFRTIPRQDTKPLAKALLAKFGSLSAVLAAPVQRIAEVKGAGPSVTQDLKIAQAIMERASKSELAKRTVITSWSQLVNYCRMSRANNSGCCSWMPRTSSSPMRL